MQINAGGNVPVYFMASELRSQGRVSHRQFVTSFTVQHTAPTPDGSTWIEIDKCNILPRLFLYK